MPDLWMDVNIALTEVPINVVPLVDDTDFKTVEESISVSAPGMDLVFNFVTTGGAFTQTAVVPTSAGAYDWTNQGNGMYTIEVPASSGASINNNAEGIGWFTGVITGVLPFRGPTIGFRDQTINDALIDSNTLLTSGDIGLLYEGTISTVNSQTSFDLDTGISTDDVWLGNTAVIEDVSTGEFFVTYVTDVVAASNRLILNDAPTFTAVATDKIRVHHVQHPAYAIANGTIDANVIQVAGGNPLQSDGTGGQNYGES